MIACSFYTLNRIIIFKVESLTGIVFSKTKPFIFLQNKENKIETYKCF